MQEVCDWRIPSPEPRVVFSGETDPSLAVDARTIAVVMGELGTTEETIEQTTVIVDGKNRLAVNGSAWPSALANLRFKTNPEFDCTAGPTIRLSTNMRGKPREDQAMNATLIHELEHVAQLQRHDSNIKIGQLAIWGLAAAGMAVGNRLAKNHGAGRGYRTAVALGCAGLGRQIGYMLAPHERQARQRTHQVQTNAITRQESAR